MILLLWPAGEKGYFPNQVGFYPLRVSGQVFLAASMIPGRADLPSQLRIATMHNARKFPWNLVFRVGVLLDTQPT